MWETFLPSHPEERDDVVLGDGLEESGSASEGLKPRPHGREEGANDDDPRRRPGERPHHQVPLNGVPKPTSAHEY